MTNSISVYLCIFNEIHEYLKYLYLNSNHQLEELFDQY